MMDDHAFRRALEALSGGSKLAIVSSLIRHGPSPLDTLGERVGAEVPRSDLEHQLSWLEDAKIVVLDDRSAGTVVTLRPSMLMALSARLHSLAEHAAAAGHGAA